MNQTKTYKIEISIQTGHCEPDGSLNTKNFHRFLHEGRIAALNEAGPDFSLSGSNHPSN